MGCWKSILSIASTNHHMGCQCVGSNLHFRDRHPQQHPLARGTNYYQLINYGSTVFLSSAKSMVDLQLQSSSIIKCISDWTLNHWILYHRCEFVIHIVHQESFIIIYLYVFWLANEPIIHIDKLFQLLINLQKETWNSMYGYPKLLVGLSSHIIYSYALLIGPSEMLLL